MTKFIQGDTVYTQDGTQYFFDHTAGDHGYVSPIIIIQTTVYPGDDFEEHEEVADHMIPLKLTSISKTPWVQKIHAETANAVIEKEAILAELGGKIGTARIELASAEAGLVTRTKELEGLGRTLEHRFQWVKDFRRMIGDDEVFILRIAEDGIPVHIQPVDIRLRMDRAEASSYVYRAFYSDDDGNITIYPNEQAMKSAVSAMFYDLQPKFSVLQEIRWQKRWPEVPISQAAETEINSRAKAKLEMLYDDAVKTRDDADEQTTVLANQLLALTTDA